MPTDPLQASDGDGREQWEIHSISSLPLGVDRWSSASPAKVRDTQVRDRRVDFWRSSQSSTLLPSPQSIPRARRTTDTKGIHLFKSQDGEYRAAGVICGPRVNPVFDNRPSFPFPFLVPRSPPASRYGCLRAPDGPRHASQPRVPFSDDRGVEPPHQTARTES